jgi:hypothetical protein
MSATTQRQPSQLVQTPLTTHNQHTKKHNPKNKTNPKHKNKEEVVQQKQQQQQIKKYAIKCINNFSTCSSSLGPATKNRLNT